MELPIYQGDSSTINAWIYDGYHLCFDAALHNIFKGHVRPMRAIIDGSSTNFSYDGVSFNVEHDDSDLGDYYPYGAYCAHCGCELFPSQDDEDYSDSDIQKALRSGFENDHPVTTYQVQVNGKIIKECLYLAPAKRFYRQHISFSDADTFLLHGIKIIEMFVYK